MPLWATLLLLALAIVVVYLLWQVLKLKAAIHTHWRLQKDWSDFVKGDLLKLCTAIRNGDQTVDCSMYAGKSPPPPPEYP